MDFVTYLKTELEKLLERAYNELYDEEYTEFIEKATELFKNYQ